MSSPVLELQRVQKWFGSEPTTHVLRGVDLVVGEGEMTALMGPSGSGKTTLLNIIGLLDRPSAGSVRMAGRETADLDESALTKLRGATLGFIFQFHHLLPSMTAAENVMMSLAIGSGATSARALATARDALRDVGLATKADSLVGKLSGGQQQRVAIARALVRGPALVLADEPTGNLDTETADDVFALLRRVHREHGTAFLIVTHDPRLAQRCDRIVSLRDGRVADDSQR